MDCFSIFVMMMTLPFIETWIMLSKNSMACSSVCPSLERVQVERVDSPRIHDHRLPNNNVSTIISQTKQQQERQSLRI